MWKWPAPPVVWKEKHLKLMVRQNGRTLALKAWNFAPRVAELAPGARVDLAFTLEEDAYSAARGYPRWAAMLRDFRPAAEVRRRHFAALQFAALTGCTTRGKLPPVIVLSALASSYFLTFPMRSRSAFPVHTSRHAPCARKPTRARKHHEEIHYENCGDCRAYRRRRSWRRDRAPDDLARTAAEAPAAPIRRTSPPSWRARSAS